MDYWVNPPEQLEGENILLKPLTRDHFPELKRLASDKRIWQFYSYDCSIPEVFDREFNKALEEREKNNQFPFIIFYKPEGKIIGSTRLLYLQPAHRKLEIGWTWLHPDYWHTPINSECKALLLTYSFDTMKAIRVQLKTDETNRRSRRAIEKLGAKFEGILRNDIIRDNGTYRSSAYYSILEDEWHLMSKNGQERTD